MHLPALAVRSSSPAALAACLQHLPLHSLLWPQPRLRPRSHQLRHRLWPEGLHNTPQHGSKTLHAVPGPTPLACTALLPSGAPAAPAPDSLPATMGERTVSATRSPSHQWQRNKKCTSIAQVGQVLLEKHPLHGGGGHLPGRAIPRCRHCNGHRARRSPRPVQHCAGLEAACRPCCRRDIRWPWAQQYRYCFGTVAVCKALSKLSDLSCSTSHTATPCGVPHHSADQSTRKDG